MLKNKKYILFDLDGTLTDPHEGITKSVQKALEHFQIEVKDRNELNAFIGPPLKDSFQSLYHMSEEDAILAVEEYRKYFSVKGLYENHVYDGIPELLGYLKETGRKIILATSKPHFFAEQILDHFHITEFFDFISGSNMDGTRVEKNEIIEYAIQEMNIVDLSSVIMIGDRKFDIIGAKQCGIDSIGVLYGYGSLEEFKDNGATYIVKDVSQLKELF